ncbi:MAG: hypothetical protein AAGI07_06805 [Bacteroidota bacterium]
MKNLIKYFVLLLLLSCNSEVVDPVSNFSTFIQGEVNGELSNLPQIDLENVNTSNTYFLKAKQTWLEAYESNQGIADGYWQIRLSGLDILNLTLPYTASEAEASVSWYDNDVIKINDDRCQGLDQGCSFMGSSAENVQVIITNIEDKFIVGEFSGRLFLTGTGFGSFKDESKYVDVSKGAFKIRFRTDEE